MHDPATDILTLFPNIADEYARQNIGPASPAIEGLWARFGTYNASLADIIRRSGLSIIETDNPEPYATSADQSADIDAGRFLVSRAFCDHPVWTVDQNVAFRIVHDIEGHHAGRHGFDRVGEVAVYLATLSTLPSEYRPCLFVESIAQAAYACQTGDFGAQKVYLSLYGPN